MHYVRFLKQPTLHLASGKSKTPHNPNQHSSDASVHALVTLETDLGDNIYYGAVDLACTVFQDGPNRLNAQTAPATSREAVRARSARVLGYAEVAWSSGLRSLAVRVPLLSSIDKEAMARLRLCVKAKPSISDGSADSDEWHVGQTLYENHLVMPIIIPQTSAVLAHAGHNTTGHRQVERPLSVGGKKELTIWEDAGVSMARHVWDAGVAFVTLIDHIVHHSYEELPRLAQLCSKITRRRPVRALELGGGCGVSGTAFGALVQNTKVLITDIAEAERLVRSNIAANSAAKDSSIDFQTLDWTESLPEKVSGQHFDVVLVADCIYNEDSIPALVATLIALGRDSPEMLILVTTKTRHSSEKLFFDMMKSGGFEIAAATYILAPSGETFEDLYDAERIDVYEFTLGLPR